MMDEDEEDFVFVGTPIEREEDLTSRKKKAVAEAAGQLRTLAPWKQEVRDEEGRRRFHGAFTGGFSAGYYNTVGTKEGWAPQTFTSSRKSRAEVKQQSIFNFLDEDEKEEMQGHSLGASLQFDTFGFTAAELARKQAEKEQQRRPSAIPGPVPDEMVLPATNSAGVKLLLKMGWRHGHSIRHSHRNSLYDARREGRKALFALSADDTKPSVAESVSDHESVSEQLDDDICASGNTPVYVLNPKQDMHGLGYDPFKHAPEFRERKRLLVSGNKESVNRSCTSMKHNVSALKSGKMAPGFGIGALEELDVEDEDIYASGFDFEETFVQEVEEPARMIPDNKQKLLKNEQGVLPGFKVASNSDYEMERFDPPSIPNDFVPHHKFLAPLETEYNLADLPPPEVPPPEDNNMRILIEGFATLVARCGKLFEDLSKEKNKTSPLFCFLTGGNGHDYYARKLWEEQQKRKDERKQQLNLKSMPSVQKMTAEVRGKILGERPLERSSRDSSSSVSSADVNLQFNLSDTFTKPASLNDIPESTKPFRDDPAKQERFERFLKEKYQGGLRTIDSGGASSMSESDRAHEKLDFEAATEAMEKAGWNKETYLSSRQQVFDLSTTTRLQFTSGGMEKAKVPPVEELMAKKMYPKREEFQWRPSPILCKRFDMIDPFMGKPPPAPRVKSRMETLIFMSDSVKTTKDEQSVTTNNDPLPVSQSEPQEKNEEKNISEADVEMDNANVERPVDLYKAIFSDDSDEEGEASNLNQVEDPDKKSEVANTTLNRLIAGDFLESLGKELGLEVPPDPKYTTNKGSTSASLKESSSKSAGDVKIQPVVDTPSIPISQNSALKVQGAASGKSNHLDITKEGRSDGNKIGHGNRQSGDSKVIGTDHPEDSSGKVKMEKTVADNDRTRTGSIRHRRRSSSASSDDERHRKHSRRHWNRTRSESSEDERFITHSKRQHNRSNASDSDSSEDLRNHDRSMSKEERGTSGAKSSSGRSRKRSKHRTDRTNSPSRSHNSTKKERSESKREKKKSRDQRRHSGSLKPDSHRKYH